MTDKYCDNCIHLDIDEWQQNQLKTREKHIHYCTKYNKQVKHLGSHPLIMRLEECIDKEGKKGY